MVDAGLHSKEMGRETSSVVHHLPYAAQSVSTPEPIVTVLISKCSFIFGALLSNPEFEIIPLDGGWFLSMVKENKTRQMSLHQLWPNWGLIGSVKIEQNRSSIFCDCFASTHNCNISNNNIHIMTDKLYQFGWALILRTSTRLSSYIYELKSWPCF